MQLPKEPIKNNKNFMNRYYTLKQVYELPMNRKLRKNSNKLSRLLNSYAKKTKGYKYAAQLANELKKPMTATRLRILSRLQPVNLKYAGEISEYKFNKLLNMPNVKNVGNNQNVLRNNAARKIQKAMRHSIKRRNNTFLSGVGEKTFNTGRGSESVPRNILNRILKQARS